MPQCIECFLSETCVVFSHRSPFDAPFGTPTDAPSDAPYVGHFHRRSFGCTVGHAPSDTHTQHPLSTSGTLPQTPLRRPRRTLPHSPLEQCARGCRVNYESVHAFGTLCGCVQRFKRCEKCCRSHNRRWCKEEVHGGDEVMQCCHCIIVSIDSNRQ